MMNAMNLLAEARQNILNEARQLGSKARRAERTPVAMQDPAFTALVANIPATDCDTLATAQAKWLAGWKYADDKAAKISMISTPRNFVIRLVRRYPELTPQFTVEDFDDDGADFCAAFEIRGATFLGGAGNMRLRPEIRNMPAFTNLAGPMFDGFAADGRPIVRYENLSANKTLSV